MITSIPSLTLGSVTSQAMGADFFDAEAFPTAIFKADIVSTENGYSAIDQLTIKDQSALLALPFTLKINDGIATMSGTATLNRMDFQIGAQSQPTEGSLAFEVQLNVALTAKRN